LQPATLYLRVSLVGLPFMFLVLAGSGAFNGRQDTRTPLIIAVAGALANLIIEVVLIIGFGYGIGASALATVIAQVGTGLVFVRRIGRWANTADVDLRPDPASIWSLAWLGRALILRSIGLRGSFTLAAAVAARIGTAPLAAYQIAIQIWSTLALALDAVAIAGQALTGKWLGAGAADRARAAARRMIQLDIAVGAAAGVIVFVLRDPLSQIFSTDPAVLTATATSLVWAAAVQPLNGYVFALDGILIGAGDMTYLGRSMVVSAAVFAGLAWWLIVTERGLNWLWASLTLFMATRALFLWIRWRSDSWLVLGV
jgi:putative MATE family efflux protein